MNCTVDVVYEVHRTFEIRNVADAEEAQDVVEGMLQDELDEAHANAELTVLDMEAWESEENE